MSSKHSNRKSFFYTTVLLLTVISVISSLVANTQRIFAIYQTNSSATELIGQPDFNTNMSEVVGLHLPRSVVQIGSRLFITDTGSGRIAVFNSVPTSSYPEVSYAIGQSNINIGGASYEVPKPNRLTAPSSMTYAGNKLIVADAGNNRILIWNSIPTTSNVPADVVLGQPDMYSRTGNNGGVSASSIYSGTTSGAAVGEIYSDGTKLFFTDTANNRVLIWNTIPTVNNTPADVVVGQPNMSSNTANNGGISDHSLSSPRGVQVIDGKLFISDYNNSRVLIFNTVPTSDNPSANIVIGQSAMNTGTANNGGISASTLNKPSSVHGYEGKLYIADYTNNRVLIFNTIPTSNHPSADIVLGQPNMSSSTANNGGVSASSLSSPTEAVVYGGKLYISDRINNRVVVHNDLTFTGNDAADLVFGHENFTRSTFRDGGDLGLNAPEHTITSDGKLIVSDAGNNRVLIWNSIPSGEYPLDPDVVLGQPDMQTTEINYGGLSAQSLYYPRIPKVCGGKLLVPDYMNRRILIWNSIPTTNRAPADVVIGQPNMGTNTLNNGGISAKSLAAVQSVACIGEKLVVGDWGNNRYLIFNSIPTESFTEANIVIGQPNMNSSTINNGGVSDHSMAGGVGEAVSNGTNLIIPDYPNSRVLIFNTIPTSNGAPADIVIGQPDMASNAMNNGGLSAKSLSYPSSIFFDGTRLLVADSDNDRVLGWNTIPTSNFQPADFVIGQANFTSSVEEISTTSIFNPVSINVFNGRIYVGDGGNRRIISYPYGAQNVAVEAPNLVSEKNITLQLEASGAKDMKVWEEGNSGSAVWETYSVTKVMTLSSGDGRKNIYVKYRDYANYEGAVLSANTVLDTTPPTGSISILSSKNNGYTNSMTVTLKLSATDNISGVKKMMTSSKSNFSGATWENYSTSKVYQLSSGDGVKVVYVKYRDAAGNVSTSYAASITLDTTAPELIITKLGNEDYSESTQSYTETTGTPTMTGTGSAGSVVTIEEGSSVIGTTIVDESGNWSFTPSTALSNGSHNLTVKVEDSAGNTQVKGLIMIVNVAEEDDNGNNTGNNTDQNADKDQNTNTDDKSKKNWINASCLYGLLILFVIVIALYLWYKSRKKDK